MELFTLLFTSLVCILLISWSFIALLIYFIPLLVALLRKHNNPFAIGILNLALGWTFFGWLAALLWSLNGDVCRNKYVSKCD